MTAPITQDVLTIPRKLPEGGKANLVGMTRDQMRAANDARLRADTVPRELHSPADGQPPARRGKRAGP